MSELAAEAHQSQAEAATRGTNSREIQPANHRAASRLWTILFVALTVTIVVLAVLYYLGENHAQAIHLIGDVNSVYYKFVGPDGCGTSVAGPGFGWPVGGALVQISQLLTYVGKTGGPTNCTVGAVSLQPSAFIVVHSNVPFTIPAGSERTLNLTVATSTYSYAGNLTVLVNGVAS